MVKYFTRPYWASPTAITLLARLAEAREFRPPLTARVNAIPASPLFPLGLYGKVGEFTAQDQP